MSVEHDYPIARAELKKLVEFIDSIPQMAEKRDGKLYDIHWAFADKPDMSTARAVVQGMFIACVILGMDELEIVGRALNMDSRSDHDAIDARRDALKALAAAMERAR